LIFIRLCDLCVSAVKIKKMNNREIILTAVARKRPDRLPYTYSATREADDIFRKHLGIGPENSVSDYFGCNCFSSLWSAIGAGPSLPERQLRNQSKDPNVSVDIWGCRREFVTAGNTRYMELTNAPLAHAETVADVERYDWPSPDEVVLPDLPAAFNLAEWKADKVVLDSSCIGPFGVPWSMFGMEKMMLCLALTPSMIEAAVARVEEYSLELLKRILEKYPGAVDLVGCGDDYGMQKGLLISKAMIDRYFMPSLRRHYELAKKHGLRGYHHCCGAIFEIIPSLIEAGVEILNPIQTSAEGMEPARIKKSFEKKLCFHGGIDIQQTLVHGTPSEVRAEVRSRIETLGPEGYILAPSHTLQADTPPENLAAMYEEARDYGQQICK